MKSMMRRTKMLLLMMMRVMMMMTLGVKVTLMHFVLSSRRKPASRSTCLMTENIMRILSEIGNQKQKICRFLGIQWRIATKHLWGCNPPYIWAMPNFLEDHQQDEHVSICKYLSKTPFDEDFLTNVSQRICYSPGCHLAPLTKNLWQQVCSDLPLHCFCRFEQTLIWGCSSLQF